MRGNTITLHMIYGRVAQTGNLWQYDYGQRLILSGVALPENYEVHFSNQRHGDSKTMIGDATGVDIPDEYLLSGDKIHVWVFLHDGASDGETEYHGVINVTRRAKPTDAPPTPVQQNVIDQAIAALNAGVSEVESLAEGIPQAIDESLQEAKESGEFDGFSPAVTITEITGGHEVTITDATGEHSFDVLNGDKGDPGDDGHSPVVTASKSGKVTTISVDGSPIATINDGQDGYSPTATVAKSGNTATITITDKNGTTTAQISDGAKGDKGDPGEIPQETLDQIEGDIADMKENKAAIIVPTVSGTIASFPDGAEDLPVKELTVGIEPVQDLHGYESPWPAGGGVNLLDLDKASYNQLAYGFTVARDGDGVRITGTATQSGNLSFNLITNYTDNTLSGKGYILQVFDVTSGYTIGGVWGFRTENERAFAISLTGIAEGQVVNCAMKLSVAATSQTKWTPYSNICPITGWTGCEVNRTGKNLAGWVPGTQRTSAGVQYTVNADGSISCVGTATGTTWGPGDSEQVLLKPGTYVAKARGATNIRLTVVNDSVTPIAPIITTAGVFTLTQDTLVHMYITGSNGVTFNETVYIQLELGSTATAYEPYSGNTYDITFPSEAGTVYGGTLTVNEDGTGSLVVDRASVDLGTLTWSWNQYNGWIASFPYIKPTTNNNYPMDAICSTMPVVSKTASSAIVSAGTNEDTIAATWQGTYLYGSNANAHPTGMLCYALATPVTYQLSNLEVIETLYGRNNVWADTGDSSVTYRADTKLYIDNKITQAIAAALNA